MSKPSAPEQHEREPSGRPALAVGIALLGPVLGTPALLALADWTFDRVDAGASHALLLIPLLAALLLPGATTLAVFAITRSAVARAVGCLMSGMAEASMVLLLLLASWAHH